MIARVGDDGELVLGRGVVIPASEVGLRMTTSGGPGGQHANRTLTKVVASFDVTASRALSPAQRGRLVDALGPVVRSSASRFRSQSQNRSAACEQLAVRLSRALEARAPRRATRPTASSRRRRVDEKRERGALKERRRPPVED